MMVLSKIHWIDHEYGGRQKLLEEGACYYPHIKIVNDPLEERWSVSFVVQQIDNNLDSYAEIKLLAKTPRAMAFLSRLNEGTHFVLLEGPRIVARGVVIKKINC